MLPGMVSDTVAPGKDVCDEIRVLSSFFTDDKEGCLELITGQETEHYRGGRGGWAVIEGKGHSLAP